MGKDIEMDDLFPEGPSRRRSREEHTDSLSPDDDPGQNGNNKEEQGQGRSGTRDLNNAKTKSILSMSSSSQTPEASASRRVLLRTIAVHVGLLVTNIMFSLFSIASKFTMTELPPFLLLAVRYNLCYPFMFLICFMVLGPIRTPPKEILKFCLLGLFGVYLPQTLYFNGVNFTTPTNATVFQLLVPPIAAIGSVLMKREKPTWGKALGIVSAVFGAFVIIGLDSFSISTKSMIGDSFFIIMCFFSSSYYLFSQKLLDTHHPFIMNTFAFMAAAMYSLVPTIWFPDNWYTLTHVSLPSYLGLLYISLVGTVFGFFLMSWCQKNSSVLTTSSYLTVQPLMTALFSSLLLDESPSWSVFVGGIFIVSGLIIVAFSRFREQKNAVKAASSPPPVPTQQPDDNNPLPPLSDLHSEAEGEHQTLVVSEI